MTPCLGVIEAAPASRRTSAHLRQREAAAAGRSSCRFVAIPIPWRCSVVAGLAPFSDVVDRDDWVIQTAGDLGLVVEALQELLSSPDEREGEGDRLRATVRPILGSRAL